MNAALRALNGFGLGARPGEPARLADPRGWLRAQLDGAAPTMPAPEGASAGEIGDALRRLRAAGQGDEQERREARRRLVQVSTSEALAVLRTRLVSEQPFVERLVSFWSNHLCVSAGAKVLVAPLAGSYEREVVRPHVLGRFEDMVLASARHPAMLAYLDNFQSVGPNSRGARAGRGGQRRGLNENYARELLELHTLGVNGGYGQRDVQELAKMLTGWTIRGLGGPMDRLAARGAGRGARFGGRGSTGAQRTDVGTTIEFTFQELLHEPGPKTLLGTRHDEAGVGEGERAIRMLCRHPSTARFVATKLVAHFVGDQPSEAAVGRVARAFQDSAGDLRVVSRALVEEPDAWRDGARKFRTPQDWLVAVLRALGARDVRPNLPNLLRQLRQPLWSPASPKGFGDTLADWGDPDSLLNRAELARTLSRLPGVDRVQPETLIELIETPDDGPLREVARDGAVSVADRIALTIAAPDFQWR